MAFLNQITTGVSKDGQRIVIAAVEKAGKTTLISNAPRALLVPMENGYASIVTPKLPLITRWEDLIAFLDEFRTSVQSGKNPYLTLSFDSATALEALIHTKTLQMDVEGAKKLGKNLNMETAHGSYGKAYAVANMLFGEFLTRCDELARFGKINIVIASHVYSSLVKDAAYGEYASWDLLLHSPKNDRNYGKREMLTQWADMVGFLHEPLFVATSQEGKMQRGISSNQGRMLAVDRMPGWVAGNRYGLTGLIPIPPVNGWNSLAHAIHANTGIDIFNRDV